MTFGQLTRGVKAVLEGYARPAHDPGFYEAKAVGRAYLASAAGDDVFLAVHARAGGAVAELSAGNEAVSIAIAERP